MQNRNRQKSVALDRLNLTTKRKDSVLYKSVRRTLFCSRVMGLLPLSGLTSQTSDKLRFTFRSPYTIWYGVSLLGHVSMALTTCNYLVQNGSSLPNISNAIFYTSSLISILVLANIGRRWPLLIKDIEKIKNTLPPFNRNISITINATTVLVMAAAGVEYILSVLYGIAATYSCGADDIVESYYMYNVPWIFEYTNFSIWKAVISEISTIQVTFLWNYNDLIVMVLSMYLTEHFIVHNELLKKSVQQEHFSCVKLRTQYLKIVRFVKLVNRQFGINLLTSTVSNLYWICVQLFYMLNSSETDQYVVCNSEDSEESKLTYDDASYSVYFTYSVSYLIIRAALVFVFAARVHSNALVPMYILHNLPSSKFNVEATRYISQIKNIKVAMSCLDFYYVTRTMVLTLFGTILTYELVLLQFHK